MKRSWAIIVSALCFSMLSSCANTEFFIMEPRHSTPEQTKRLAKAVESERRVKIAVWEKKTGRSYLRSIEKKSVRRSEIKKSKIVEFKSTARGKTLEKAKRNAIQQVIDRHSNQRVISNRALQNGDVNTSLNILQNAVIKRVYVKNVFEHAGEFYVTITGKVSVGAAQDVDLPALIGNSTVGADLAAYEMVQQKRVDQAQALDNMFNDVERYFKAAYSYQVVDKKITSVMPDKVTGYAVVKITPNQSFWERYSQVLGTMSTLSGSDTIIENSEYYFGWRGACAGGWRGILQKDEFVIPAGVANHIAYPIRLTFNEKNDQGIDETSVYVYKNLITFNKIQYGYSASGGRCAKKTRPLNKSGMSLYEGRQGNAVSRDNCNRCVKEAEGVNRYNFQGGRIYTGGEWKIKVPVQSISPRSFIVAANQIMQNMEIKKYSNLVAY